MDNKSREAATFWLYAALLVVEAFLVYSPALKAPFLFDDFHLIVNNPFIKSVGDFPSLFQGISGQSYMEFSYRPLQLAVYMAEHALWGMRPFGFHMVNLLVHLANALLIFLLLKQLRLKQGFAFFAALLFLIHPMQTAAVSYVSGLADSLAVFFILLALLCHYRYTAGGSLALAAIAVLCFCAALFSKEAGLQFAAVILLFHRLLRSGKKNVTFAGVAVIAAVYCLFRAGVVSSLTPPVNLTRRLLTAPFLFFKYLSLIAVPVNLRLSYAVRFVDSVFDPRFVLPAAGMILFIAAAYRLAAKAPLARFGLSCFLINFFMVSGAFPLNAPFAEHWLYWGVAGVFIFAAALLARLPAKTHKLLAAAAIFLAVAHSAVTLQRGYQWADPVAFYANEIRYTPANYKAHLNLGLIFVRRGDIVLAEQEFIKAIRCKEDYGRAFFGLGMVEEAKGNRQAADFFYRKAALLDPSLEEAVPKRDVPVRSK